MGFLSNLLGAAVKTALLPVGVAKDIVDVTMGEDADATKDLLEDVGEDLEDAGDDLAEGNFL